MNHFFGLNFIWLLYNSTMYKYVNPLEDFEERASGTIMRDREAFRPFMEVIESFASRYRMMACNHSGTDIYLQTPISRDSFVLEFYSQSPKSNSRQLADELVRVNSPFSRMIQVVSKVPQQIYTIFVNCREVTTLYKIPAYHDLSVFAIMDSVKSPGRFGKSELLVVGVNIQLMELYKELTSLSTRDMWPYLMGIEKRLRTDYIKRIGVSKSGGVEADETDAADEADETVGGREYVHHPSEEHHFIEKLVYAFCVAAPATAMLTGPKVLGKSRLQIITAQSVTESETIVNRVAESEGLAIQVVHTSVRLPIDPKLSRFSVKIKRGVWRSVADIFNLATYEMLPYVRARDINASRTALKCFKLGRLHPDTRIATLPTLMRMRLVDAWSMKIVAAIRSGSEKDYAERTMKEMTEDYAVVGDSLDQAFANDMFDFIFPSRFIGDFVDDRISVSRDRQKMFVESGLRPDKYIPALSIKGYEQDDYIDMVFQP